MRSFNVEENYIGSAVSEIIHYRQNKLTLYKILTSYRVSMLDIKQLQNVPQLYFQL